MLQTTETRNFTNMEDLEFLWYLFSILWHTRILTLSLEYFLPSDHQVQASQ